MSKKNIVKSIVVISLIGLIGYTFLPIHLGLREVISEEPIKSLEVRRRGIDKKGQPEDIKYEWQDAVADAKGKQLIDLAKHFKVARSFRDYTSYSLYDIFIEYENGAYSVLGLSEDTVFIRGKTYNILFNKDVALQLEAILGEQSK